ncbi:MAG: arsenate reductase ArsC [Akkermansiaceae bacterium]|nr:arsenate reductase ArsC [Akkermansiaceae bacterium]NNM28798.1 arsenate reductase ArsC [Akkermansiaceae bacterium]
MKKPLVLILCTGNSCRSQMAEAFLREAAAEVLEVASAGSQPAGHVVPGAIETMAEIGIDISGGESKHMNEFLDRDVAVVITVCGNAEQACPVFPGQIRRYHWPFEDPVHATGTAEEVRAAFRTTRDDLRRVFGAYGRGWVDASAAGPA